MGFDSLIDILKKVQGRYPNFSRRLGEAEALGRWEAAVGPIIARHARAIKVKDQVLWVEVDHAIWKSELHHRKQQILDILNAKKEPVSKDPNAKPQEILKDILLLDKKPINTYSRYSGRA